MGAHTYGPDDGEPAGDAAPETTDVSDVRLAGDSGDEPAPVGQGDDDAPADAERGKPADVSGENPESAVSDVRPTRPRAGAEDGSVGKQLREGWKRFVNAIATAVIIVSVVIAILLALHIVFEVFDANPHNGIVQFVNGWATGLAYGFRDLFVPKDALVRVTVNYALAAVVYLVVGRVLAGVIRRLG